MSATPTPRSGTPRSEGPATVGYGLLLAACAVASVGWSAAGAGVAAAAYWPAATSALTAAAAAGSGWARALLAAVPRSEPWGQALLDHALVALNLGLAIALLVRAWPSWVARLTALATVASAGAFTLQGPAAAAAVDAATGVALGGLYPVVLPAVAGAAYVLALLLFPNGRWQLGPEPGSGSGRLVLAGAGGLLVVGLGAAVLPQSVGCILFLGIGMPLVGLAALPRRIRHGATAVLRARARLLFSVLLGAFGTMLALGLVTFVLRYLGQPGLTLVDPSVAGADPAAGRPTALLFWFSRLAAAGIAGAVLVAVRQTRLWATERVFSRGLASVLAAVAVGGGYLVVRAVTVAASGGDGVLATTVATVLAGLALLPLYTQLERAVDRLLYGRRPTPYRVLADVSALSQAASSDGPNLARVAEVIGRGLGARSCRLAVLRPGLRDRTYTWAADPDADAGDHVEIPIRQGAERVGSIAVDQGAVAGLNAERRHLLEDVADSLGAVLQASRLGIELERQLRAALAHAEDIAVSRRQAVAEMDSERRAIERDLHDGAQLHLVTLRLALGLVEHEVGSGQLEEARDRLGGLAVQLDTAEAVLAKTAAGVSSTVLPERGLVAALRADLAGSHPPVLVDDANIEAGLRFSPDIEAAVYFCCLESVSNARKHAPGATVRIEVAVADGRLTFAVRDDGPGFTPGDPATSAGRGLRNLAARVMAVGGEITVDSAPGAGTAVRGSVPWSPVLVPVPVPAAAEERPAPSGPDAEPTLLDRARDLVETARTLAAGRPERTRLDELAARLDAPPRWGVVGPPGPARSTLVSALTAVDLRAVVVEDPQPLDVDALVVLVRDGHPADLGMLDTLAGVSRPVAVVVAPAGDAPRVDPDALARAAVEHRARGVAAAVLPLAGLVAAPGATLSRNEHRSLRALGERFVQRADLVTARSALDALDALVRDAPGLDEVRYQLERVRSGAHELAEIDLADALRSGTLQLTDADRYSAEQLLGAAAGELSRLGLAVDAPAEEVRRAAGVQLGHWQRLASHPASTRHVRVAAAVLVRTCEELLAHPGAR